ncbi:hypothetical protein KL934_000442 [Ogataea polymorpha]|nr:hypothetical protein KL934_000442 [Ogataea polymorpha]
MEPSGIGPQSPSPHQRFVLRKFLLVLVHFKSPLTRRHPEFAFPARHPVLLDRRSVVVTLGVRWWSAGFFLMTKIHGLPLRKEDEYVPLVIGWSALSKTYHGCFEGLSKVRTARRGRGSLDSKDIRADFRLAFISLTMGTCFELCVGPVRDETLDRIYG